jgi:four helix bundle protein
MLAHEKLEVYQKALCFVAAASDLVLQWDRKHAVTDQLDRASDSLIVNLAEAARLRSPPAKLRTLDYSIGSCLECAACLDIARVKRLLTQTDCEREKNHVCEIVRMLAGLRKAWAPCEVREEGPGCGAEPPRDAAPQFHQERLDVYALSLQLMEWFVALPGAEDLPSRLQRHLDESLTGIPLNIAAANGRYSELDHRRFLDWAASSATKMTAGLDLAMQRDLLREEACSGVKEKLARVVAMLSRM